MGKSYKNFGDKFPKFRGKHSEDEDEEFDWKEHLRLEELEEEKAKEEEYSKEISDSLYEHHYEQSAELEKDKPKKEEPEKEEPTNEE